MSKFVLYCRPGFEKDCAAEAQDVFSSNGWDGYPEVHEGQGLVTFAAEPFDVDNPDCATRPSVRKFIFARHILEEATWVKNLPAADRASRLAEALLKTTALREFRELVLEFPDTNEGRALANFCKKFHPAMGNALKRSGVTLDRGLHDAAAIHICFLNYETAVLGLSWKRRSSEWRSGIPRLKFPEDAPSRSTLKLEEAFLTMLSEKERENLLVSGGTAVDLGASPGGWTYQLLKHGFFVTAVDNGKLAESLVATGMTNHLAEDAFKYRPKQAVDLVVCDMVERPQKVTPLMAKWMHDKLCGWAIFNLKLPMKKRFQEVQGCIEEFWTQSGLKEENWELRCKQLYHNRDEVTVVLLPRRKALSRVSRGRPAPKGL